MHITVSCSNCTTTFTCRQQRLDKSKSGLLFCCRACKDSSQGIGKLLQPSHYGTAKSFCKYCKKEILQGTVCADCQLKTTWIPRVPKGPNGGRVFDGTIGEVRLKYTEAKYGPWNVHTLVRDRARNYIKKLGKIACEKCGYDKHVQAAHIKAVSSFSDDALLSEVNSPENILALCPNCHWEFDHHMWTL